MAGDCRSLISCFPDVLLRYCLDDLEMVPVAPVLLLVSLLSLLGLAISFVTSTMSPRRKIKRNTHFSSQIIYLQ